MGDTLRLRWLPPLALVILLMAAPPAASAPGSAAASRPAAFREARKVFRQGIALFDAGDYRGAIEAFQRALVLYPSPKIHTRIALAYQWLGEPLKALEHCEIFLRAFPEQPKGAADVALRERTEKVAAELRRKIAYVTVVAEGPPGLDVRLDGRPLGAVPLRRVIRLMPGAHHVTATAGGHYPFQRDLRLAAGERVVVAVTLVKVTPKVITRVVVTGAAARPRPFYKQWWFWTAVGIVVAGATGATAWWLSRPELRDPTGLPLRYDALGWR